MSEPNPILKSLLDWCEREIDEMEQQNELMKKGAFTLHTHEPGKGMVDKTEEGIARNIMKIEELQRLLGRHARKA